MNAAAREIMDERFGRDQEIALATLDGDRPSARIVDAFYRDGSFYTITHAKSGKMKQIAANPVVAVCGEWFTGHGIAQSMGWLGEEENREILTVLKSAFSAWYNGGHVNEKDPNTIILRIRMTDGLLMSHGTTYELEF